MAEQRKIEFIEYDDGSWFWCILKWSEQGKEWYNSQCNVSKDYETAVSEAFKAYNNCKI